MSVQKLNPVLLQEQLSAVCFKTYLAILYLAANFDFLLNIGHCSNKTQ